MTTFTKWLKVNWKCSTIIYKEFQDCHRSSHRLSVQMFVSTAEGMVACHCIGHAFWICLIHHPNVGIACIETLLVSTYVVCERLSVMHEPAGVVEILVQILTEYPLFWSSEYPPKNESCQRVQIREFQNTPPNENCHRVQIGEFQNTPPIENCHRVQIWEFQNPPQWKLSQSPNLRVSEYPPFKWKLSQSPNLRVSEYPPSKWKLSQSPNPRVSEYPPKWELSQSLNPRVSGCPPNWKLYFFFLSPNFMFPRIPPPQIVKTSDFKLQNSLKIREIYVEICNPPGYHSLCTVTHCQTRMSQSLPLMPLFPATLLVGTLQNKHETHGFVCSSQEPSHLWCTKSCIFDNIGLSH